MYIPATTSSFRNTSWETSGSKDDPNKTYQVQMSKRLGQTAELNYDEGDEGAYFGLWTDEVGDSDTSDDSMRDQFGAIANAFEGAELTVTVTFEDGHTSTQVINLHAGNFLADWNDGSGEDLGALAIQPTLLEDGAEVPDCALVLRTVRRRLPHGLRRALPRNARFVRVPAVRRGGVEPQMPETRRQGGNPHEGAG